MRFFTILITLLFSLSGLYSQNAPGAAPGQQPQVEAQAMMPAQPPRVATSFLDDTFVFATTTYTFQDIVLFSYFNESVFYLISQDSVPLDTVYLDANQFHSFSPGAGIYRIEGNNSFSLLIGDPVSQSVMGFFAVDESGSPVSTRLNTFMPASYWGGEHFIVFAYNDGTEVTVKSLTDTSTVAAGILNEGEHMVLDNQFSKFLGVTANKPVSALSYADQGYFIPATNGTFSGTHFYGFSGYVGSWANGVIVTAYNDSTNYLITDKVSGDTLDQGVISAGEAASVSIYGDTYWEVVTDKVVTVCNTPYAAWTGNYYYMARQIDESGLGLGTHFYTPVIGGDFDIFSFENNNQILITNTSTGDTVYNDVLPAGGHHRLSSTKTIYEVNSSENVSIITSTNGGFGADFMPLNFALALPDLSISSADITFDPDSANRNPGDPIKISAEITNVGFETAYNVPVQFFDGDPQAGYSISPVFVADSIPAGESVTFTQDWTVPDAPEYHAVYVAIDRSSSIVESNSSNNSSFRFIVPNMDLLPPLVTVVDAPTSVKADGDVVEPEYFDVVVNIFNNGNVAADSSFSTLYLPAGLSVDGKGDSSVVYGDIPGNTSVSHTWTVHVDSVPVGDGQIAALTNAGESQDAYFYSIHVDANNAEEKYVKRMLLVEQPTSLDEDRLHRATPQSFSLKQNYPNPFNPQTTIAYSVAKEAHIVLEVYDVSGRKLQTLVDSRMGPGDYNATYNGTTHSSGMLFVRLMVNGVDVDVRKMLLIK